MSSLAGLLNCIALESTGVPVLSCTSHSVFMFLVRASVHFTGRLLLVYLRPKPFEAIHAYHNRHNVLNSWCDTETVTCSFEQPAIRILSIPRY